MVKLIKTLYHCSLPQNSRADSSGPAQAHVSKSIANLGCRCPACSSLHWPLLFTSFGLLPPHPPLRPFLALSSSCSRIVFHTNTPPHSTTCSHSVSPGDGSSRFCSQPASAPKLDVLLSRCPNRPLVCFHTLSVPRTQRPGMRNICIVLFFI